MLSPMFWRMSNLRPFQINHGKSTSCAVMAATSFVCHKQNFNTCSIMMV
jgi:hypothetical protein